MNPLSSPPSPPSPPQKPLLQTRRRQSLCLRPVSVPYNKTSTIKNRVRVGVPTAAGSHCHSNHKTTMQALAAAAKQSQLQPQLQPQAQQSQQQMKTSNSSSSSSSSTATATTTAAAAAAAALLLKKKKNNKLDDRVMMMSTHNRRCRIVEEEDNDDDDTDHANDNSTDHDNDDHENDDYDNDVLNDHMHHIQKNAEFLDQEGSLLRAIKKKMMKHKDYDYCAEDCAPEEEEDAGEENDDDGDGDVCGGNWNPQDLWVYARALERILDEKEQGICTMQQCLILKKSEVLQQIQNRQRPTYR